MLKSEKRSFKRFITLYIILITLIILMVDYIYYKSQEEIFRYKYKNILSNYASKVTKEIKWLHYHFSSKNKYPRNKNFRSAIYDIEKNRIFSTLKNEYIDFNRTLYENSNYIYYQKRLDDYYLGAKYLFIEAKKDPSFINNLIKELIIFSILALIVFTIIGYFLTLKFTKPMKESIKLLDDFIKDTTHEINTPISAILTNIETINKDSLDSKIARKITRVEIAAKTLNTLYEDLKYLTFNQKEKKEKILLKDIIKERVEFFKPLIDTKKIYIKSNLDNSYINIDKRALKILIDNILSNAIKYNKRNGSINIKLSNNTLIIEDSGIGIDKDKLPFIFERYKRFNDIEGGFGIGLNIVKNITDKFNISIKIDSTKNKGTKVVLKWEE